MRFSINDKVARKRGRLRDTGSYPIPPVGETVTVSRVWVDADGDEMIDLVEYPHPDEADFFEGYFACAFEKVVERKTDISIFTEILDRVNGNKPRVREVEHQS